MQVKHLDFKHDKNAGYFFKDISFKLEPGKLHALHGKNGTGKTVLLNILSGRIPDEAIVKGEIIGTEKIGTVDQSFDDKIADRFSFEENLQFACLPRFPSPFSRLKAPRMRFDFLEKFQIDPSKPVNHLSGGQRQILALSAVMQRPVDVLLLDEPTAALDEENAESVFKFLTTLARKNITLLIVCHQVDLLDRYTTGKKLHLYKDASGVRKLAG